MLSEHWLLWSDCVPVLVVGVAGAMARTSAYWPSSSLRTALSATFFARTALLLPAGGTHAEVVTAVNTENASKYRRCYAYWVFAWVLWRDRQ